MPIQIETKNTTENDQKWCSLMKTGDIIAFSGKNLGAKLIRWATNSPYSHLAIVLDTEPEEGGRISIAESTTFTMVPNFRNEKCSKGVQIHWLTNWLAAYKHDGQAWWIPLDRPLTAENRAKMQAWVWQVEQQKVRFGYHKAFAAWLKNKGGLKFNKWKDSSSLFCSELVVKALQIAGAIEPHIDASLQTPKDAIALPCFQERHPLLIK